MVTPRITKTCKVCGLAMQSVFPETLFNCHPDQTNQNDTQEEAERLADEMWAKIPYREKIPHAKTIFKEGYRAGQASKEPREIQNSMRKHYEKMFQDHNDEHDKKLAIMESRASQFYSTIEEMIKVRDSLREENERLKATAEMHASGELSAFKMLKNQVDISVIISEQLTAEKAKSLALVAALNEYQMADGNANWQEWNKVEEALAAFRKDGDEK